MGLVECGFLPPIHLRLSTASIMAPNTYAAILDPGREELREMDTSYWKQLY